MRSKIIYLKIQLTDAKRRIAELEHQLGRRSTKPAPKAAPKGIKDFWSLTYDDGQG